MTYEIKPIKFSGYKLPSRAQEKIPVASNSTPENEEIPLMNWAWTEFDQWLEDQHLQSLKPSQTLDDSQK